MKARLIRSQEITHPDLMIMTGGELDQAATLRARQVQMNLCASGKITSVEYKRRISIRAQEGHIVDHPAAWMLVRMGAAEPYDEECRQRCGLTAPKIEAALIAGERLNRAQLTGQRRYDAADGDAVRAQETRLGRLDG
jgi:hypothetical protein